jgi:hypothetical protein
MTKENKANKTRKKKEAAILGCYEKKHKNSVSKVQGKYGDDQPQ